MNNYQNAPQTKLLATNCVCCGRPLVDAISVSVGMGPDCRNEYNAGISPEVQSKCNQLTCHAAIAAQNGDIESIYKYATEIETLGLIVLADKVRKRFVNAKKNVKIKITEAYGNLYVTTPYKRTEGFVRAWRAIEGRTYRDKINIVPKSAKPQVWALLKEYFPKVYGEGPKGLFRVPEKQSVT